VAQIAKSIAIKLNHDLEAAGEEYRIEPDIVEYLQLPRRGTQFKILRWG